MIQLWCVHFKSEYYDNDPRMPGSVPVNEKFYVPVESYKEAHAAVALEIGKLKDKHPKHEIETLVVPLENLVAVARTKVENAGWYPTHPYTTVRLPPGWRFVISLEKD